MDVQIIAILLITFSPIITGIVAFIYLENKRSKKISKKPKGTLQEIFGL